MSNAEQKSMTYKCQSCSLILTVAKTPKRQPLCPSCAHHPRMYPRKDLHIKESV